jgi:formylglycine-generating enzyme
LVYFRRTVLAVLASLDAGYKNSQELLLESYYQPAVLAIDSGEWETARNELAELAGLAPEYKDSQELLLESYYQLAVLAIDAGEWTAAMQNVIALRQANPDYIDSKDIYEDIVLGSGFVLVPAGEFIMGSDEGESYEGPVHTVYLDDFWIMRTEVTNREYGQCVAAGGCSAPDNSRWDDPDYAEHPVTHVSWNQAHEYAEWMGGALPTEAQWEEACRGTEGVTYPWGNSSPNSSLLNFYNKNGTITPVGSYPDGASPYGVLYMAANVWEWTADWYDDEYYQHSPAQNPTGPSAGSSHVIRGGAFISIDDGWVRCASRYGGTAGYLINLNGFRLATGLSR